MSDFSNLENLAKVANAVTGDVHVEMTIASDAGPNQEEIDAVTAFMGAATPAAVLELIAENNDLRTGHSFAAGVKHSDEAATKYIDEHWRVQRDELKAEVERLKHENRLLTEHNEFLASSDSRLAPELRSVKDALGLDFTASVSGEVVPLIERLRKLPTCWTEVLEQSEANDQLLDQVLELSRDADRLTWLDESAEVESVGPMRCCGKHLPNLREAIDAAMALEKSLTQ